MPHPFSVLRRIYDVAYMPYGKGLHGVKWEPGHILTPEGVGWGALTLISRRFIALLDLFSRGRSVVPSSTYISRWAPSFSSSSFTFTSSSSFYEENRSLGMYRISVRYPVSAGYHYPVFSGSGKIISPSKFNFFKVKY